MPVNPRTPIETYEQLANAVDHRGGLTATQMGTLRDIHGAGKLGSIVVNAIHDQLESHGLGHAPFDLPTSQDELVIIYRKGTPVARVIEAVTTVSGRSEGILRDSISRSSESSIIIQKIREMVCE